MSKENNWYQEVPFAITVSDTQGNILLMNDRSLKTFEKYGGGALIGQSLFNCHPEPASEKLRNMLTDHSINAYTIEKEDLKKMIYQSPWFENGEFAGYVELSLVLPNDMPHFIRK
jgi:transcriptional regulator with PAS, ATPase and Fis domain